MRTLASLFLLLFSTPLFALGKNALNNIAAIELGRYLYHDVRLSVEGNRSCALCHNPDLHWTNSFQKVPDINGNITRLNTPSLLNVVFNQNHTVSTYHVISLEEAVSRPLLSIDPLEMGATKTLIEQRLNDADSLYAPLFGEAFGDREISYPDAITALSRFVASISSFNTAYHRFLAGEKNALNKDAKKGLDLFNSEQLGCANCHSGKRLNQTADSGKVEYYNVGLYGIQDSDGKAYYPVSENGLRKNTFRLSDDGRYRTPSLINVANTGPWGHDGSFSQLSDVIGSYTRGGRLLTVGQNAGDGKKSFAKHPSIKGFPLSNAEKDQLLAFLDALSIDNAQSLATQTQSPFCQLVPLKNRIESDNCIVPFRPTTQ